MRSIGVTGALLCCSFTSAMAQVPDLKIIPDLWAGAYEKGDASSIAKLYAPDAVMIGVSGQRSEGQSAIETALQRGLATSKSRKLTLRDKKLREFGDMAVQNDTWEIELVSQDDKTTGVSGRSSVVYQRTPQGWWIVDHHTALTPRN
jgi:uncharacterized protein (TIGR02246 family)